jgi:hypothetical protein
MLVKLIKEYTESDYQPKEDLDEEEEGIKNQLANEKQMNKEGSDGNDEESAAKSAPAKRSSVLKGPLSKRKEQAAKKAHGKKPTPKRRRR